ncbi:hypothetical protein K432DRAFT_351216 [Lepidopterella palustris CBS 459.81]|uniref:Uncharacterized protein n=1 Tax=Lepidopterella palustris CBS 459.81 TaxID=1314670 RepID=A0A8E2ECA6_9PEZI|nr:hypothetical protein K432DRAFT_351216 [Lepidopterella palustris CBS 459.81]
MSVKGGATTNLDNLLPQPAEDDAISGAMSRLRDNIKNHVQSYYHTTTVAPNVVDESRLGDLAAATRIATWTLRDLLLDPATRTPAIRLFLGWLILSRCSQDAQPSLLPSEVSASVASMPGPDATNAARLVLFSKWKAITCTLLQQRYGEQIVESDTRNRSITDAIAVADSVLHPFINTSVDMTQRHRNLEMITRRAAQFAFLLFSQPGSFHFSFTKTGQQDSLVVFPALLQTINDQAQVLSPPRVICEKEIVTGLGG